MTGRSLIHYDNSWYVPVFTSLPQLFGGMFETEAEYKDLCSSRSR